MSEESEVSLPGAKRPLTPFRVAHGVVKTVSIVVGLPLTVLALMSLVGLATDSFWIRSIPAVIVALAAPLFLVERLLPDDDQDKAQGLPTDTLALFWLGFALLFVGVGQPVTGGMLRAEAQRYADSSPAIATSVAWLAGPVEGTAEASGDRAEVDAGARDAGPAADAASADAAAGPDADRAADAAPDAGDGSTAEDQPDDPVEARTDGASVEFSPSDIFRKAAPAVVTISVKGERGPGSGTGFFIDDDGTLATNQHVVHKATGVSVKLMDGNWASEVELLFEDEEVDLALLKVTVDSRIEPLPLGDSDEIEVGQPVICIGNPLGLEHTLSDGLISSRRRYRGRNWVQMTAPISPGNSGGPVMNMRGQVIGIATATINRIFGGAQNLNLAVPVNVLKGMLQDEYPDRRKLGVGPQGPSTW